MNFRTLDQAKVEGKTVLVRVDINSPIDPNTGKITDDTRIRECIPTLKELSERGAKVVVLAHQGRPGDEDFTTLEMHAKKLSEISGLEVKYIPDILGPSAQEAIKKMRQGEILLLENVRFCAEESLSKPPKELAKTYLVQELSKLADIYVNDAFAAAHRSQPSLVGFGMKLPTFAGRLMEREIKGLSRALSPERPCIYVLGGVKVDDSIKIAENVLNRGIADEVLTGGLVSFVFLEAAGVEIGDINLQLLAEKGFRKEVDRAKKLLENHRGKIELPLDVVVDDKGKAKIIDVKKLPTELIICDIGPKTVEAYSQKILKSKTVVANGPMGVFEKKPFSSGTFEILRAMARSSGFTIIGGGHLVAAAHSIGVAEKIKHVSTGGGACISFLAGEKLPVLEMFEVAKGG